MRGGTGGSSAHSQVTEGLSPRARGNRYKQTYCRASTRSIPACAGEPASSPGACTSIKVYPRVRGGTRLIGAVSDSSWGLSPRARGNQRTSARIDSQSGSIPACAGEPSIQLRLLAPRQVYPRVRGGTRDRVSPSRSDSGLSPRARGNRNARAFALSGCRSIPACAGEPWLFLRDECAVEVYPRVRGGTRCNASRRESGGGLSPRARGNRWPSARAPGARRSIPACAGEPRARRSTYRHLAVYPRVRGGTITCK